MTLRPWLVAAACLAVALAAHAQATCDPSPCGAHGTCAIVDDAEQCACTDGFQGKLCSVAPCVHGEYDPATETCVCAEPYAGPSCLGCRRAAVGTMWLCVSVFGMRPVAVEWPQLLAVPALNGVFEDVAAFVPAREIDGQYYDCGCGAVDANGSAVALGPSAARGEPATTVDAARAAHMAGRFVANASTLAGRAQMFGVVGMLIMMIFGLAIFLTMAVSFFAYTLMTKVRMYAP
jgi:hypothetical protein